MGEKTEISLNAMQIYLKELSDLHKEACLLDSYGDFEQECIDLSVQLLSEAKVLMENLSVEAQTFYEG